MTTLLWIVAAILLVTGVLAIICRQLIKGHHVDRGGAIGPGEASIFARARQSD